MRSRKEEKLFFFFFLNLFLPQTILWFATVSYDGIPFGWEIYATRMTRGCRGSTRCAPWSARTESILFRIYRWREWVASGRTLEEPRRWAPVTFTPIRCYDYWSSPLLCSNCDVRSCDALGHLSFLKREPVSPWFARKFFTDAVFPSVFRNRVPRIHYLCFYRRAIVSRSRRRDTIERSISIFHFAILSFDNVDRSISKRKLIDRKTSIKLN